VTQPANPKRRWYHLTPNRLIIGLLAVEVLLLLSEQFQWFAFNEKKGWTVLVAVAAVCVAVFVMLLWLGASLLFRWRFQFTVRSLVVLVVAVAVPCCWLTVKMRGAERQRQAVEAIEKAGGRVIYHHQRTERGYAAMEANPPAPVWLRELVGDDFFADVDDVGFNFSERISDVVLEHVNGLRTLIFLELSATQATDAGLEHLVGLTRLEWLGLVGTQVTDDGLEYLKGLTNLEWLTLDDTQVSDGGLENLKGLTQLEILWLSSTRVTDTGLQHLKGLTKLEYLNLHGTQVTSQGIKELQEALPNCEIIWDEESPQPPHDQP
jgi:hypothetical protein